MRSLVLATLALMALEVGARPALAEPAAAPAPVLFARGSGGEGLALYAAGRWAEAFDSFRRADAAYHAPTLVLYMAHAQKKLGRLATAKELYRRVVAEPLSPSAPAQFWRAQSTAREELDALRARVPALSVTVTGSEARRARVTIDGEALPADEVRRELDPGEHFVEATLDGITLHRETVSLEEGKVVEVKVRAGALPGATVAPAPVPPPAAPPGLPVAARVAFGAAGIALVVSAATGIASAREGASVWSPCRSGARCVPDSGRAATAGRLADAAAVSLAVGGVAGVAGLVVVLVPGRGEPRVSLKIGPGSGAVGGAF